MFLKIWSPVYFMVGAFRFTLHNVILEWSLLDRGVSGSSVVHTQWHKAETLPSFFPFSVIKSKAWPLSTICLDIFYIVQ